LKSNPPFPTDFNDETEDENVREKRANQKISISNRMNKNKMDEKIRDIPHEVPENSKFHGFSILNDLEN
jgi:hypothetical protein